MVNVQMCLCWVVGDGQCTDVFVLGCRQWSMFTCVCVGL